MKNQFKKLLLEMSAESLKMAIDYENQNEHKLANSLLLKAVEAEDAANTMRDTPYNYAYWDVK